MSGRTWRWTASGGLRARYGFITNPPRTFGATVRRSF
jgi:hypothetical protein